jgi:Na+-driven multidrug efflux pump
LARPAGCAAVGLLAALFPEMWLGLFSKDEEVIRVGTWYLQIVGPIYGFYGLGLALHSAMQGFASVVLIVLANAVRLLASAGGALLAIYWLDLGAIGFFVAVAIGFCAFAAMAVSIMFRLKEPGATRP